MARLIERAENGQVMIAGCGGNCKHEYKYCNNAMEDCPTINEIYEKLALYEDAEEQGLLPRFHLGDEFWIEWLGEVLKAKIVMLQQKKNGTWKYRFCDEHSNTMDYEEREYEKNFWFTKEQAEQALAELKGGGNNG